MTSCRVHKLRYDQDKLLPTEGLAGRHSHMLSQSSTACCAVLPDGRFSERAMAARFFGGGKKWL